MFRRRSGLTFFLLLVGFSAFGQLQKTIHKTFQIDTANTIQFDIYGDFEVATWAGDNILSETKVKLFNASKNILNFFVGRGRYDIESELVGKTLTISSHDKVRPPIANKEGESKEIVAIRIFIPDTYEESGENTWVKIEISSGQDGRN